MNRIDRQKTLILASFVGIGFFQTQSASAFNHYRGRQIPYSHTAPSEPRICDAYKAAGIPDAVEAICKQAASESRETANKYAALVGKVNGYYYGYSWGLEEGVDSTENSAQDVGAGRESVNRAPLYDSVQRGFTYGAEKGSAQGNSSGRSDAIERFVGAVNSGREPVSSVNLPNVEFSGVSNGYELVIGKPLSTDQLIKQELNETKLEVCSAWDTTYLDSKLCKHPYETWGYYGSYTWINNQWYDGRDALKTWLRISFENRSKFDGLGDVKDASGKIYNLKAVFEKSFVDAYQPYAQYVYEKHFDFKVDDGAFAGLNDGRRVGHKSAFLRGQVQAFNEKFLAKSINGFQQVFRDTYVSSFQSTFADYANNPKVDYQITSIVGEVDDGVIQPGEKIGLEIQATNFGGKSLQATLAAGGIATNSKSVVQTFARISRRTVSTGIIAQVASTARIDSSSSVSLLVNGSQEDTKSLVIQRLLRLSNIDSFEDIVAAKVGFTLKVQNSGTVPSAMTTVKLISNGSTYATQSLGKISAGQFQSATLTAQNINSLQLIDSGFQFQVVVTMGDSVIDTETVSSSVDRKTSLAELFAASVNGTAIVGAGLTQDTLLEGLKDRILATNLEDVQSVKSGNNLFKKDTLATILGLVVSKKQGSNLSSSEESEYNELGLKLWAERTEFKKILFVFKSGKQAAYEKLVQKLSKTGKYPKK